MKIDNTELSAFYNVVEEIVISIFGSYEKAAAYFEEYDQLNWLWDFTEEKFNKGWSPDKVARVWHSLATLEEGPVVSLTDLRAEYIGSKKPYKRKYAAKPKKTNKGWLRLPTL